MCCNPTIGSSFFPFFFFFSLRNGNTKPTNSLERRRALWLQCSVVHISGPDEPAEAFCSDPSPPEPSQGVCQCSRRGRSRGEMRWHGVGRGVLLWWSQLVVAAINQQWSGITGVVVRPRCNYPLGKRTTQDRQRRSSALANETVGSLICGCQKFCARFPPRPVTTIIMWNVCLSKGNGVTLRQSALILLSRGETKICGKVENIKSMDVSECWLFIWIQFSQPYVEQTQTLQLKVWTHLLV